LSQLLNEKVLSMVEFVQINMHWNENENEYDSDNDSDSDTYDTNDNTVVLINEYDDSNIESHYSNYDSNGSQYGNTGIVKHYRIKRNSKSILKLLHNNKNNNNV
jgi:hypothetical protein